MIEAIKLAEKVHLRLAKIIPKTEVPSDAKSNLVNVPKAPRKQSTKVDLNNTCNFEFEKDKPTGLPYIYLYCLGE